MLDQEQVTITQHQRGPHRQVSPFLKDYEALWTGACFSSVRTPGLLGTCEYSGSLTALVPFFLLRQGTQTPQVKGGRFIYLTVPGWMVLRQSSTWQRVVQRTVHGTHELAKAARVLDSVFLPLTLSRLPDEGRAKPVVGLT